MSCFHSYIKTIIKIMLGLFLMHNLTGMQLTNELTNEENVLDSDCNYAVF